MKVTNYSMADMPTKIAGIPCIIAITHYDMGDDDEGTCVGRMGWVVCDRKGYKAAWLQDKMSLREEARINAEVIRFMSDGHRVRV